MENYKNKNRNNKKYSYFEKENEIYRRYEELAEMTFKLKCALEILIDLQKQLENSIKSLTD